MLLHGAESVMRTGKANWSNGLSEFETPEQEKGDTLVVICT